MIATTQGQRERLEQLLAESSEGKRYYVRYWNRHNMRAGMFYSELFPTVADAEAHAGYLIELGAATDWVVIDTQWQPEPSGDDSLNWPTLPDVGQPSECELCIAELQMRGFNRCRYAPQFWLTTFEHEGNTLHVQAFIDADGTGNVFAFTHSSAEREYGKTYVFENVDALKDALADHADGFREWCNPEQYGG